MKVVYFTHSLASCWNHGNAHFLRGVVRTLIAQGHHASVYEPADAWSMSNLLSDHGEIGLAAFREAYQELRSITVGPGFDPSEACEGADLVIVHEWNEPALVAAVGRARRRGAGFVLLFHDTHHRAVSDPTAISAFDLSGYDGALVFGEALAAVYRSWGWGERVFVWHEAADTALFRPPAEPQPRQFLVWIGNWGDDERTAELETFMMAPAEAAGLPLDIYGVRYPDSALAMLRRYGGRYRGWLPNARVPEVFARHLATVHVPRCYYAAQLPGIPTIRVFEALACGIPLVSAPWQDVEGLFRPGEDFLVAADGAEMTRQLRRLRDDPDLREALVSSGLARIHARHTCAHRVAELLAIASQLGAETMEAQL